MISDGDGDSGEDDLQRLVRRGIRGVRLDDNNYNNTIKTNSFSFSSYPSSSPSSSPSRVSSSSPFSSSPFPSSYPSSPSPHFSPSPSHSHLNSHSPSLYHSISPKKLDFSPEKKKYLNSGNFYSKILSMKYM